MNFYFQNLMVTWRVTTLYTYYILYVWNFQNKQNSQQLYKVGGFGGKGAFVTVLYSLKKISFTLGHSAHSMRRMRNSV